MELLVGNNAPPVTQLCAWIMSKRVGVEVQFDPESDEVFVDGVPSQVAWKSYYFGFRDWQQYVALDVVDLDFEPTSAEEIQIYYGLKSQNLLNFAGYETLSREWSPEFETILSAEGYQYIRQLDYTEFSIRTSVEFIEKPNNTSICAQFVYVTSKSRRPPTKSFPKGCAPFFYEKYLKIGINAVAFVFTRMADPSDCLLYLQEDDAAALGFDSGTQYRLLEVQCDVSKLKLEEKIDFNLSLEE